MSPPRPAEGLEPAGAILAAAGRGERMGGIDKALVSLGGRTMVRRGLDVLLAVPEVAEVVVVVPPPRVAEIGDIVGAMDRVRVVPGGKERQDSVAAGLAALGPVACVVVHDAARPLASPALAGRVLAAARADGAATAALPVHDTIKMVADGRVQRTVPRDALWLTQTPQAFRTDLLREAHARARRDGRQATDDAALVEALGHPVKVVEGETRNLKITTPEDLRLAEAILADVEGGFRSPERRVGLGYDVHRLVPGRRLVLGGVEVDFTLGLAGHSDGDAVLHAVADALLGAAGLADIGHHFPADDDRFRDADSRRLLAIAAGRASEAGFVPTQVDVVVMAEAPRLAPYRDAMRAAIAGVLGLEVDAVGLKATTTDGLGAIGRGEGIAAQAVVTLERRRTGRSTSAPPAGGWEGA